MDREIESYWVGCGLEISVQHVQVFAAQCKTMSTQEDPYIQFLVSLMGKKMQIIHDALLLSWFYLGAAFDSVLLFLCYLSVSTPDLYNLYTRMFQLYADGNVFA